jgi:exosortase/archaeosortase family protein
MADFSTTGLVPGSPTAQLNRKSPGGGRMQPVMFWASALLIPAPLLALHFMLLWRQEHYRYYLVLLFAFTLVLAARWDRKLRLPDSVLAWLLVIFGIASYVAGTLLASPGLSAAGWVAVLGGWLRTHAGDFGGRYGLLGMWPPFWLLVQLPDNIDLDIIDRIFGVAARWSSFLLDWMRVPHILNSLVFTLPDETIFVEKAAGGYGITFLLIGLAVVWVAWLRRSVWLIPAYVLAMLFSACVVNSLRIATVIAVQYAYGYDLMSETPRLLLGGTAIAAAVGLLASFDRLLRIIFFPVPNDSIGSSKSLNPLQWMWNACFSSGELVRIASENEVIERRFSHWLGRLGGCERTMVGMSLFPLVVLALLIIPQFLQLSEKMWGPPTADAESLDGGSRLPESLAPWQPVEELFRELGGQVKYIGQEMNRAADGAPSDWVTYIWSVKLEGLEGLEARLVVSPEHSLLHDVARSYRSVGWAQLGFEARTPPLGDGPTRWSYADLSLLRPGEHRQVLFSAITSDGRAVDVRPRDLGILGVFGRLANRTGGWIPSLGRDGMSDTTGLEHGMSLVVIQLIVTSPSDVTPTQAKSLRRLHLKSREIVRAASRQGDSANVDGRD